MRACKSVLCIVAMGLLACSVVVQPAYANEPTWWNEVAPEPLTPIGGRETTAGETDLLYSNSKFAGWCVGIYDGSTATPFMADDTILVVDGNATSMQTLGGCPNTRWCEDDPSILCAVDQDCIDGGAAGPCIEGSCTIEVSIWDGDPCAGGAQIPGTALQWEVPGTIYVYWLRGDIDPPVAVPQNAWTHFQLIAGPPAETRWCFGDPPIDVGSSTGFVWWDDGAGGCTSQDIDGWGVGQMNVEIGGEANAVFENVPVAPAEPVYADGNEMLIDCHDLPVCVR